MHRIVLLAGIALTGCGLYTGDDTGTGVDGGGLEPMAGSYRATWTCATPPCANPIANTVQAVIEDGSPSSIAWIRNGEPTAIVTHYGERNPSGHCITFDEGTDLGVSRGAYAICFNDGRAGLSGGIEWAGTFSDVELLPL